MTKLGHLNATYPRRDNCMAIGAAIRLIVFVAFILTLFSKDASAQAVQITQPYDSQTVHGSVGIAVWTNNNVLWVNWYVDGKYLSSSPGSTASAWEYYWDSNSVANGSHTISVAGFDSSHNRIAQPSLTVNVQNSSSGSSGWVSIVAPSAGSTVSGNVPFTAQSSSSVVWINYYIDGGYVWSSPSYTYNWNSTGSGSGAHTLMVKGYDGSGNQLDQKSISVTVGGSSGGSGPTYFSLQTVGAQLPTGDQCAQWVHSQGGSETEPANAGANQTTPTANELQSFHSNPTFIADLPISDYANIDGNFTGSTIQIIRWASCKWGIDENAMKAQAWEEAIWAQSETGDWRTDPSLCQAGSWNGWTGSGCWQSYGIYQEKPVAWNIWPEVRDSTAFNADFRGGYLRACINGDIKGLDNGYPYGDTNTRLWGCMGEWYSGHWYDSGAYYYIGLVQNWVNTLPWQ
jgi:hypothetical protein